MNNLTTGFQAYKKALELMSQHGLLKYMLIPLVLNLVLFAFGIKLVGELTDALTSLLNEYISSWIPDLNWGKAVSTVMKVLTWIALKVAFLLLYTFIGAYLILILLSPLMAYLSEKTEAIITQKVYHFSGVKLLKDAIRGMYIASRNFIFELFYVIVFTILGLIPVFNLFSPLLLFLISAYYFGFSFMDYCNERRRANLREGIAFIRKNKVTAIAIGSLFGLTLMIPFIGIILGGFMSLWSVVAGTIAYLELDD